MKLHHNAHMLIPQNLWDKLRVQSKIQQKSIKAIVVDALRAHLER